MDVIYCYCCDKDISCDTKYSKIVCYILVFVYCNIIILYVASFCNAKYKCKIYLYYC